MAKIDLSKNYAWNYNSFMSKKISLYVVAKKEVALLFIFMFLVSATSFIFGIKVGKEHAYRESDVIRQDRNKVQMLSSENNEMSNQIIQEGIIQENDMDTLHTRLEEAIKRQMVDMTENETTTHQPPPNEMEDETTIHQSPPNETEMAEAPSTVSPAPPPETANVKKYTIQLGSYRSRKDAEAFAQGFTVRGYQAMIREVSIPSKGTWFRVSLGTFDTSEEAKKYIQQEESLFQGEDYIINILL